MHDAGPTATTPLPACIPGFLSAEECARVIADIDAAQQQEAQIWVGDGYGVRAEGRRGGLAELTQDSEQLVLDRLWGVLGDLEQRFGLETTHVSAITALVYRAGDHFAAHSDGGVEDDLAAPPEIRRRRISLVVALNDGASDFSGGDLHFHPGVAPGVQPQPDQIVSVRSEPGLLIAFPSPMTHRVAPVVDGCRYSLALWALRRR